MKLVRKITQFPIIRRFSSKFIIKIQWFFTYWKKLNLKKTVTFSEKLQYLKLHEKNHEMSLMVDKYEVRNYISNILGDEYLIPIYWVGDDPNKIPFDLLPNQFVIKCTHGSHCNIICKDKEKLDLIKVKKTLKKWLKINWFYYSREWPYRNIKHRIIIEKYMNDGHQDLLDYKFFCFKGKISFCQIIRDRSNHEIMDFYDESWNRLNIQRVGIDGKKIDSSDFIYEKPDNYDEMICIAKKLSKNYKFSRIDLYLIDNKVYFGEITFYPAAGFCDFYPNSINVQLGDLIEL